MKYKTCYEWELNKDLRSFKQKRTSADKASHLRIKKTWCYVSGGITR